MARTTRYRLRYTFWLNHLNQDEITVADTIERLKNERSFAAVVRDGIMLVSELRAGRIDLLLRLFPWIADAVKPSATPPHTGELERKIEQLQSLILQQGAGSPNGLQMLPATTGGTVSMSGNLKTNFQVAAPVYDEEDTIVINRVEGVEINFYENMMKACQAAGDAPPSADAKQLSLRPMNKRARSEADDNNLIVKRAVQ